MKMTGSRRRSMKPSAPRALHRVLLNEAQLLGDDAVTRAKMRALIEKAV